MAWTDEFWKPIRLNDGRTIRTLDDARAVVAGLPELRRVNQNWQEVSDLLSRAAISQRAMDDALIVTLRALRADGLV
jgi:hypothetical protein